MQYLRLLAYVYLLFSVCYSLQAQRLSLASGYSHGILPSVDEATQAFNFTHPSHALHHPLRHGTYVDFEYSFTITNYFFIGPRVSFWQLQHKTRSFVYPVTTRLISLGAQANFDLYVFALKGRGKQSRSFSKNFYLNFHFGTDYLRHRLLKADERVLYNGELHQSDAFAPLVGIGFGYDIFTLPTFSFTPEFRVGYTLPFRLDNLAAVYTGNEFIRTEERSSLLYGKVGILIRLHSEPSTRR